MIERHKPAKHQAEIATRSVDKLQEGLCQRVQLKSRREILSSNSLQLAPCASFSISAVQFPLLPPLSEAIREPRSLWPAPESFH